jgi:DNA-binding MarR family transcriptional regulator
VLNQDALKKYAGYLLARSRWQAFRNFEQHIGRPFELRPVEFSILVLLDTNRDVSQSQLSQALGVAAPNMTGILRRLEARGLIARERAALDKRVQHIVLTASGRESVAQAEQAGSTMDKPWLSRLSPAEQAMLFELLGKTLAPSQA